MSEHQDPSQELDEHTKAVKSLMVLCAVSHLYFKTHSEETCSLKCHQWLVAMAEQREVFVNQLEFTIDQLRGGNGFSALYKPQMLASMPIPRLDQLRSLADRRLLLQSLQHERLLGQYYRHQLNRIWPINIRSVLSRQQTQIQQGCFLIIDLLADSPTSLI